MGEAPLAAAWQLASDDPRLRHTAVIDLGSNSFRLVVFTAGPGWWQRTDEIYEPVRVGEGIDEDGVLHEQPMRRALEVIRLYGQFCRARELEPDAVHAVATSAIREAANRDEFLERAQQAGGMPVRVLSREEEARFAYLAAVNSTTLDDGAVLDLGGGSLQLVSVRGRREGALGSWPLGAVRMTERFLPDEQAAGKQLKALRAHVRSQLEDAPWLAQAGERLVGLGGAVRNLAVAAQRAADLPGHDVQGFELRRPALDELIERLAELPAAERARVPGIKPERGDIILAAAVTVAAVLRAGDFEALEVTEAGLREGVFFAALLAESDPPLLADVRGDSVRNLAARYAIDPGHVDHVEALALSMFDGLAAAGLHPGDPWERELLAAAAALHDIGMTVDYDDHHRHSRYLVLNAGLPGFSPREVALIAQLVRYHRKGSPGFDDLQALAQSADEQRLRRCAVLLRLAERLERSRDQLVRDVRVTVDGDGGGPVRLGLVAAGDVSVARWEASRCAELFERAFDRPLQLEG